jgi:peptidoglycan/xylan/chitin deacetylase (PgdA/CDA1 family)
VADWLRHTFNPSLLVLLLTVGAAASAQASDAVVLLYHHVAVDTPAATSVRPETFDSHLDYLEREGYGVVALSTIVDAISGGAGTLPPKAVALTFDDAYRSIYTAALPRLEARDWPFTVFVSTQAIDQGYANFMTWDELRDLEARGATIANHSATHGHLIRRNDGESEAAWRSRVRDDIVSAQSRLKAELANPSPYFAYPYGEFDTALERVVADLGLVAFGQQSGAIGAVSSLRELARYPMATGFDSIPSLAQKLRTRALPVRVLAPESRVLAARAAAPVLRVALPAGPYRRDALRCYVAGQDPATITWDGDTATIRAQSPLGGGRHKYNCTAPSTDEPGVYYWYSHLWMQRRDDGSWYAE